MNGLKLQRGDSVGHLGEICEALQQSLRKLLKKKKAEVLESYQMHHNQG